MKEKNKDAIIEILRSNECKEYFESLLNAQTDEISHIIAEQEGGGKSLTSDDLMEMQKKLEDEKRAREQSDKKIFAFEQKNEDLQNQNTKLGRDKKQLYEENDKLIQEKDELQRKIERQKERLQDYEQKFADIDEAYSTYNSLSTEVKQQLKNIFKDGNLYAFVLAGSEWNYVKAIWNFAKTGIVDGKLQNPEKLVTLFKFLFKVYSTNVKGYELIVPEVGEKFDSDLHIIKGAKTDGYISKVLLEGILDVKSGKSVYKAIVKVQ
jgi:hypothetical protein